MKVMGLQSGTIKKVKAWRCFRASSVCYARMSYDSALHWAR